MKRRWRKRYLRRGRSRYIFSRSRVNWSRIWKLVETRLLTIRPICHQRLGRQLTLKHLSDSRSLSFPKLRRILSTTHSSTQSVWVDIRNHNPLISNSQKKRDLENLLGKHASAQAPRSPKTERTLMPKVSETLGKTKVSRTRQLRRWVYMKSSRNQSNDRSNLSTNQSIERLLSDVNSQVLNE